MDVELHLVGPTMNVLHILISAFRTGERNVILQDVACNLISYENPVLSVKIYCWWTINYVSLCLVVLMMFLKGQWWDAGLSVNEDIVVYDWSSGAAAHQPPLAVPHVNPITKFPSPEQVYLTKPKPSLPLFCWKFFNPPDHSHILLELKQAAQCDAQGRASCQSPA